MENGVTEKAKAQAPHPAEWLAVGLWAACLGLLAYRNLLAPEFLQGQLLPCAALGLTPGSVLRLAGRRGASAHRAGVALCLVSFMIANGTIKWGDLRRLAAKPELLAEVLLLAAASPVLGALRWRTLLAAQDVLVSVGDSVRLVLVGTFFNSFVPGATGGDLFRAYHIAKRDAEKEAAVISVVFDRFLGLPPLAAIMLIGGVCNYTFISDTPEFLPVELLAGGILLALLIFTGFVWWLGSVPEREAEAVEGRLPGGRMLDRVRRAVGVYKNRTRAIALALLLGLAAHCCTIYACWLLGDAVGVTGIPAGRYALVVPAGLTVNALPVSPGGLGVGEAAFGKLFDLAGPGAGNGPRGAAVMLSLRICMLLVGMVGGAIYALGRHERAEAGKKSSPVAEKVE